MSNTLNTMASENITAKQKDKLPLWFIILFAAVLIFISISLVAFFTKQHSQSSQVKAQQQALEAQRSHLLSQDDVIDTNWLRTLNPIVKDVKGRLIWSTSLQQGIMEFENLPKLDSDKHYKLWVYDLVASNNKAVEIAKFREVNKKNFLVAFSPYKRIDSPLKFELSLEQKGQQSQPLLLAQP